MSLVDTSNVPPLPTSVLVPSGAAVGGVPAMAVTVSVEPAQVVPSGGGLQTWTFTAQLAPTELGAM